MSHYLQIFDWMKNVLTSSNIISFFIGIAYSGCVTLLGNKVHSPSIKLANKISLCNYHRFIIKACNDSWFKKIHNARMTIILVHEYLGRTIHEKVTFIDDIGTLDKKFICRHDRFFTHEIELNNEQMAAMCKGAFLHVLFEGETRHGDKSIVEKCFYLSKDVKAYTYKRNSLEFNVDMPESSIHYIMKYAQCIGENFYVMNT